MTEAFLVHTHTSTQEIIAVFDKEENPIEFFVQRKKALNLDEIIEGKITLFNKTLKGYFVLTTKGKSVFVPSNEKYTEGQSVHVKITKEARLGKDATGVFTNEDIFTPNLKEIVLNKYPLGFKNNINILPFIEESLENIVPFANGASLLIERTNALWTIDIDSGNSPFSLFEINQKAIPLIAKQIILKNISGMILIDFAGFKTTKDKDLFLKEIKKHFKEDNRTKIYDFTRLNLLEIKRARTSTSLYDLFYSNNGIKTPEYINLYIQLELSKCRHGKPILKIHPSHISYLPDEIKNNVQIQQDLNIQPDFFDLKEK